VLEQSLDARVVVDDEYLPGHATSWQGTGTTSARSVTDGAGVKYRGEERRVRSVSVGRR
jgi:hypothetical protein